MGIVSLSGWGQPHDALAVIAPGAAHIDYARQLDVGEAVAEIAAKAADASVVIGWSLGGQLLLPAVAAGMVKPKYVVLIATSYQFVSTPNNKLGMGRDTYGKFRDNYARDPMRTLNKAWELIAHGDSKAEQVRGFMEKQDKAAVLKIDWLSWLDALDGFTADGLDLSSFPPTLLIHGDADAVVYIEQSKQLAKKLPRAKLITCKGCGHAPHWHDPEQVKKWIREFAHV